MSAIEELLAYQIRAINLPEPVREHKFHDTRKWRMDFAWPDRKLCVEVEGGVYSGGRHTRGSGFERDIEKYNTATLMGWSVFRFSPSFVKSGEALKMIEIAINGV